MVGAGLEYPTDITVSSERQTGSNIQSCHTSESLIYDILEAWQRLLGVINFAAQALPSGKLHFRGLVLSAHLNETKGGDIYVTSLMRKYLSWWAHPLNLKKVAQWRAPPASLTVWTDASKAGWGLLSSEDLSAQGIWINPDSQLHITAKELLAVLHMLSQPWSATHPTILVMSDCRAVVSCINYEGSTRSKALQRIYHQISAKATSLGISLRASHIAGVSNVSADLLSRTEPVSTEWTLTQEVFEEILRWHGPLQVDLFATPENAKLKHLSVPSLTLLRKQRTR